VLQNPQILMVKLVFLKRTCGFENI